MPAPPGFPIWGGAGFVVTRLHARYTKDSLGEDLVFRAVPPIQGGREWRTDGNRLEKGALPGGINNFQARYAIRHGWTGPIACANPVRGRWGGPPVDGVLSSTPGSVKPATKIAYAPRGGVQLASFLREDVPEIGLQRSGSTAPAPSASAGAAPSAGVTTNPANTATAPTPSATAAATAQPAAKPKSGNCALSSSDGAVAPGVLISLFALSFVGRRRVLRERKTGRS
jgi:hypothetical protein